MVWVMAPFLPLNKYMPMGKSHYFCVPFCTIGLIISYSISITLSCADDADDQTGWCMVALLHT